MSLFVFHCVQYVTVASLYLDISKELWVLHLPAREL